MATTNPELVSPVARAPRSALREGWKQLRTPLVYLLPALVIMMIVTFYPLAFQVWMSFTDYGVIKEEGKQTLNPFGPGGTTPPNYRPAQFVGFKNYLDIITNNPQFVARLGGNFDFWRLLTFNLWWTFSNVGFHVALGIIIAVLLNVEGLWGRKIYRAIYILPMVLPNIVVATVWRNMFDDQYGSINQLINLFITPFGFDPVQIRWFNQIQDPIPGIGLPLSYYAMLIANIWLGWPFMTIVATGALQSIPKEMYEAASIDGATGMQQFWRITLPLLRPAMVPAAMVGIVTTFNLFHVIYFMSGGGPLGRTEIMVTQAFKLINVNQLYGVAAAFSVIIALVLIPIFLITNKISRATESYDV
ncbi:carbohydrate ABC transporter permease [Chloroflexus sp.]|uniref:carbohydrate ABC transporter permease n=1 Tax=Chloroflexus sp. TaxID=1904827 RepID=UPI0026073FCF|nr:sugar ABC transporter permease [uncultured Chloroflexus sp.]